MKTPSNIKSSERTSIYGLEAQIQIILLFGWLIVCLNGDIKNTPAWRPSFGPAGRCLYGTQPLPCPPPSAASTTSRSSSLPLWTHLGWWDCRQCPAPTGKHNIMNSQSRIFIKYCMSCKEHYMVQIQSYTNQTKTWFPTDSESNICLLLS